MIKLLSCNSSEFVNDNEASDIISAVELKCVVIGFVAFGSQYGFLGNASIKFCPDACKWPDKYQIQIIKLTEYG